MNMNIDRHNYEEFFLLYIDNELSPAERKAVEEFVAVNTDLQSEFDLMKDTVLQPEPALSYDFKASLMKHESDSSLINDSNCEEYFILYADDELTADQKTMVEKFVYHHPQHQTNFELLQQVKFTADTSVIFPDKSSLYRKEKEDKVVPVFWFRMMAAAVVLMAVGIASWFLISNSTSSPTQPPVIARSEPVKPAPANADKQITEGASNSVAATAAPVTNEAAGNTPERVNRTSAARVDNPVANNSQVAAITPNEKEKKSTPAGNISTPSTVLPIEQNVAIDIKKEPVETRKPIEEIVKPEPTQTIASLVNNAPTAEQIGYQEYAEDSNSDVVFVANTSVSKKSKLRGVFRKASRFLEKATNLEPGSRGIRVANVEIGLK